MRSVITLATDSHASSGASPDCACVHIPYAHLFGDRREGDIPPIFAYHTHPCSGIREGDSYTPHPPERGEPRKESRNYLGVMGWGAGHGRRFLFLSFFSWRLACRDTPCLRPTRGLPATHPWMINFPGGAPPPRTPRTCASAQRCLWLMIVG